jgi:hypothetical protein
MNELDVVEEIAADVHFAWMLAKRGQGVTSRLSETGEELMVPYEQLSEEAKNLDRATVLAVLEAPTFAAAYQPVPEPSDVRRCRYCGCTDDRGCRVGCWWVEEDLCSACAQPSVETLGDGLRAAGRLALIELRHAGVMAGYWLRPYDSHRDARRWMWQRPGCPTPAERARAAELLAEIDRAAE